VVKYRNLGAVDLKRESTVQYTRYLTPNQIPAIPVPAYRYWNSQVQLADGANVQSSDGLPFDPSEFTGIRAIRFRAVCQKTAGVFAVAPAFRIVDELGAVYLTVNPVFIGQSSIVDLAFTPDVVAHTYFLQLTKTAALDFWGLFNPYLYIASSLSQKMTFQVPIGVSPTHVAAAGPPAVYSTTSAVYVVLSSAFLTGHIPAAFTKTNWATVTGWTLRVIANKSTDAGNVALFNRTANAMVAGSEIAIGAGDGVHYPIYTINFADNAVNFTAGNVFELRGKTGGTLRLDNGALYLTCNPVTATKLTQMMDFYVAGEGGLSAFGVFYAQDWPLSAAFGFNGTNSVHENINLRDLTAASNAAPVLAFAGVTGEYLESSPAAMVDQHHFIGNPPVADHCPTAFWTGQI
jgi:hypothetical protein